MGAGRYVGAEATTPKNRIQKRDKRKPPPARARAEYCIDAKGGEDEPAFSGRGSNRNAACRAGARTCAAKSAENLASASGRESDSEGARDGSANLCVPGWSGQEFCLGSEGAGSGPCRRDREKDCASLPRANLEAR